MRIALDERYQDVAHQYVHGHEIVFYKSGVSASLVAGRPSSGRMTEERFATPDEFLEQVGDSEVLGCGGGGPWPFDERIINALPRLRFIQKIGAGIDWFDLDALNRRGILLATNAGLNATSVADHLVMLMLLCLRSALDPILSLRNGEWVFVPPNRIVEVEDATVGIIGFGKIGLQIARRVLAFGEVRVLAHRRRPLDPATTPQGVRAAKLDELLRECEVVVVCLPLTPGTDGLIGARELALMKPGSVLINGSRGHVVDETALHDALASGHLKAAASDVFAEEPPSPDNPLLRLPNFMGTPHMAGRSRRNSPRQIEQALENINVFLAGGRPQRLVNPDVLERGMLHGQELKT